MFRGWSADLEEDLADPGRHGVGGGRAEVDVEDDDGDDDGQGDEDHGEEQVLADQRHDERRRRDDLGEQ